MADELFDANGNKVEIDEQGKPKTGNSLRQQLEDALAKLKTANEELTTFKTKAQTTDLTATLTALGVRPGFAKIALSDGVDPADAKSVEKWATENADLYGFSVQQANGETPTNTETQTPGTQAQPNQAQASINALYQKAAAPNGEQELIDSLNGKSDEEVAAILTANGISVS